MAKLLLETDVLVDYSRQRPQAVQFMRTLSGRVVHDWKLLKPIIRAARMMADLNRPDNATDSCREPRLWEDEPQARVPAAGCQSQHYIALNVGLIACVGDDGDRHLALHAND